MSINKNDMANHKKHKIEYYICDENNKDSR